MKLGLGQWKDTDYVFTEDGVSPIVPNKLTDDFTALCDKIGLEGFTFHGTRHTHITALLKTGRQGRRQGG
jgi:integrase